MSTFRASRFVSKPDPKLESLTKTMENAKALYEYAKEQSDRAEKRLLEPNSSQLRWTTHLAIEAYSFRVETYLRATTELNQYLFNCEFPEKAKVLGAAA